MQLRPLVDDGTDMRATMQTTLEQRSVELWSVDSDFGPEVDRTTMAVVRNGTAAPAKLRRVRAASLLRRVRWAGQGSRATRHSRPSSSALPPGTTTAQSTWCIHP